ncbi:hypothetical protein CUJ84_pRLN1000713 (plasmid) [Rhizobium leguminosarum]|uniref:Uncharacterized protein n=1 Tax=Rhizobium leguminosarum TaxID=384 RepID=A0A2K9ZD57_RHILE|nr:hypothetical protein CUJ84_pRLN1000713 [Rhizobium leguminosarum]
MVQKIRKQDEIITRAPLHIEGTAGDRPVSVGHAGSFRVLPRQLQHGGPVDGDDLRRWKCLGDFDPENAWPCSDVQDLFWRPRPAGDFASQYLGAEPAAATLFELFFLAGRLQIEPPLGFILRGGETSDYDAAPDPHVVPVGKPRLFLAEIWRRFPARRVGSRWSRDEYRWS